MMNRVAWYWMIGGICVALAVLLWFFSLVLGERLQHQRDRVVIVVATVDNARSGSAADIAELVARRRLAMALGTEYARYSDIQVQYKLRGENTYVHEPPQLFEEAVFLFRDPKLGEGEVLPKNWARD